MSTNKKSSILSFVACGNNGEVLKRRLLASPCLKDGHYAQAIYFNESSPAAAFNKEIERRPNAQWLVWAHQDVYLPLGWDQQFITKIEQAIKQFPKLAVVGVYGISGHGAQACRAGNVLDREEHLMEPAALPSLVDSLDGLLFAVRTDSGLRLDPALGFDFYDTDIVLTAQQQGYQTVVVDAYCEHWSNTSKGLALGEMSKRVVANASAFERKWSHRFPITTPCFTIQNIGDVARQCAALSLSSKAGD